MQNRVRLTWRNRNIHAESADKPSVVLEQSDSFLNTNSDWGIDFPDVGMYIYLTSL